MRFIIENGKEKTLLPRILTTALQLFVHQGIDRTTTKDIAKKAKVAEGTLYRHFKSKEDLAWYLFKSNLDQFSQQLEIRVLTKKGAQAQIEEYFKFCFSAFEANRDLFSYLILSEHKEFRKYPENALHPGKIARDIVQRGQANGQIRSGDAVLLGGLVLGGMLRACILRSYGSISRDLKRCSAELGDVVWDALKGPSNSERRTGVKT